MTDTTTRPGAPQAAPQRPPLLIRMHPADNVAIVANDAGLAAGTVMHGGIAHGLVLKDKVPQGHKAALVDIPAGAVVRRYNVSIGTAKADIAAGSWVHERRLTLPAARTLQGLPMATVVAKVQAPLTGYTFKGYRNADGSVGTRNILAITAPRDSSCGRSGAATGPVPALTANAHGCRQCGAPRSPDQTASRRECS